MWARRVVVFALASCVLLPLGGCGGSSQGNQPKLVPVSGSITLDGKAASGVMVSFVPTGQTRGEGGNAVTDSAGRYELKTRGVKAGIPAGEYRVTCQRLVMPDGSVFDPAKGVSPHESGAKQVLPPAYSDAQQTTLKATVTDKGGTFDFGVKSGS